MDGELRVVRNEAAVEWRTGDENRRVAKSVHAGGGNVKRRQIVSSNVEKLAPAISSRGTRTPT